MKNPSNCSIFFTTRNAGTTGSPRSGNPILASNPIQKICPRATLPCIISLWTLLSKYLKIIRLFQNGRFSKEDALLKLNQVETIVMSDVKDEKIDEYVESLQLSMLVLFAGCKRFLEGTYSNDIKTLVKDGKKAGDENLETALDIAAEIGANVINGATCCGKYIKDDIEQPGLFDEWLIEIESMHEAMASLKNFDEEAGETS